MAFLSGPPEEGVELPFEPIHEGWSIYKTKDDVTIKMRLVVLRVILADVNEAGNAQLALGSNLLFAVVAPPKLKGTPNKETITQQQTLDSIIEPEVPFETVKEEWNDYNVEGIKLGVKPVATVIAKTSLFDGNGDPVYNVNYQSVVRAITKPEDKEKFLKIKRDKLLPAKPKSAVTEQT